jgi:hypothetical protein
MHAKVFTVSLQRIAEPLHYGALCVFMHTLPHYTAPALHTHSNNSIVERWTADGRPRQRSLEAGLSRRTELARHLFCRHAEPLPAARRREAVAEFGLDVVVRQQYLTNQYMRNVVLQ